MSETPPPSLDKKEVNWLSRILKLVFILLAFFLVGITVLFNMGGNSDSLKSSVQNFTSELFHGRPTEVDKLVYMSFFPRLGFDAEGIKVLSSIDEGYNIVEIGKIQVFMGFWDVAFRNPRVKQFYIGEFKAIKGAVGAKEFYIEKIFIDHDVENNAARLSGNGEIGDNPWAFNIDIEVSGSKGEYKYILKNIADFTFNVADISTKGTFIAHEDGYFKFENFEIISEDIEFNGDLTLSALGKKMLKLKGAITSKGSDNPLSPDLIFNYTKSPVKIDGVISSNSSKQDIADAKNILLILEKLRDIVGYEAAKKDEDSYDWAALFDFSAVKITNTQEQE